jgi:hypothetical protein
MLEQIKTEMGFSNVPAAVQMKSGKTKYGVIIDFIDNENYTPDYWKFVSNYDILKYEQTENPSLVEILAVTNISYIDAYLK